MRKLLAGLLLLIPGTLAAAPQAARTRDAKPKSAAQWLQDLDSGDCRVWSTAMDELEALGAEAVPALVRAVSASAAPQRIVALRAGRVLRRIGAPAAGAVPALLDLLARIEPGDSDVATVVFALGELVPYAPRQRSAVRDAMLGLLARRLDRMSLLLQTADFVDVCRALARTQAGPETPAAELVGLLGGTNPFEREFAAELLAARDSADDATIAALLLAVRGPHPDSFQPDGLPRVEVFLDRRIQAAAARAMVALAPTDARSVEAFALLLDRPEPESRLAAVAAARHLGAAAAQLLPCLMRMAQSEAAIVRREAITTLGILGPVAAPAAELLDRLSADPDPQIAERARAARKRLQRP